MPSPTSSVSTSMKTETPSMPRRRKPQLSQHTIYLIRDKPFVRGSLSRYLHAARRPDTFPDIGPYETDVVVSIFEALVEHGAIAHDESGLDLLLEDEDDA